MAPVHVTERSGATMGSLPKLGKDGEATYAWGCGGNASALSLSWSYTFWTSVVYLFILVLIKIYYLNIGLEYRVFNWF